MKSYTNLEQSKKLAEILPLESADMYYPYDIETYPEVKNDIEPETSVPCWSLAALLDVIPYPSLHKTFLDWRCDSYNKEATTCKLGEDKNNPIDTCYEMIIRLHEMNLL